MEEFDINRIKLLLLTLLILTLSSGIGAAIEVHPGESIQAAVNSANPQGDTIIVHPGTYYENLDLSRTSNLKLLSASQNASDTIIVSNAATKSVISATTRPGLVIRGFTISGAANDTAGVRLDSCRDCIIEKNIFLNDALGIYATSCVNTTISNNIDTRTSEAGKLGRGIDILRCQLTTVSSNTISNHRYGIYFSGSQRNTISGNSISQCTDDGMRVLSLSDNSALENNVVSSNGMRGIYLKDISKSSVKSNNVSSNGGNGIDLELSSGNTVLDNVISGNAKNTNIHGLFVNTSKDDYLKNNTISNCQYGVATRFSENNSFVNNKAYDNAVGFYVSYTSSKITLSGNKANSNNNGFIIERGANNNIVDNNEVNSNSASGISLDNAINNKIFNNSASSNNRGIYLLSSSRGNTLSGNIVNSNRNDGIVLENASENNVTSNIANQNTRYGIYATNSNNSYMINNTVQYNVRGISLQGSEKNTISKNIATGCSESGLFLTTSSNNTLSKNIVFENKEGISLDSSGNNEISSNNVSSNGNGIYMCPRSYPNLAYDNYFNNSNNANIRNSRSSWNIAKTPGKNIMGGRNLGGNYWGNPAGLGFSDTYSDSNGDGIIDNGTINGVTADLAFVSANGNITDYYPLAYIVLPVPDFVPSPTTGIVPLTVEFKDLSKDATGWNWDFGDGAKSTEQNPKHTYSAIGTYNIKLTASNKNGEDSKSMQITVEGIKPFADFSTNVTSGYAPLSVLFTDLSQNAVSRNWDIWNDGVVESTDASIVYVFTSPGTYPVSLTAVNPNGTSSKPVTITVMEQSSSNGGSSGGSSGGSHSSSGGSGGGGGGGSPEPAKNVQVKELSQVRVTSGKPVKFDFAKNATCVVYVSFDAKKTCGKTTTIAEQLKAKSTLVSNLSSGEVYRYFNLWVGNAGFATEKNIENPVVCFKVEKSWVKDQKIDQNSIALNRYNDKKWTQMPAKLLREDDKYLYFTTETPGFSFFAITGKAIEKETAAETKPATEAQEPAQDSTTVSETEQIQKPDQETGKDKVSSIPGFEGICALACLIMVFLHRRK